MSKKSIYIDLGGSNFTAWNVQGKQYTRDLLLVNIEGWDSAPEIRRNSAPILWEHGETQSTNALYGPRHLEITLHGEGSPAWKSGMRIALENACADLNTRRAVQVTTYDNIGAQVRREVLYCRFEDNAFDWEEVGNTVTITLYMIAPNPLKTIYYAGSAVPFSEGRV